MLIVLLMLKSQVELELDPDVEALSGREGDDSCGTAMKIIDRKSVV